MAEQKSTINNEPNSNPSHSSHSNHRCLVPIDVSGPSNKRKQDRKRTEESTVRHNNLVQFPTFTVGLPIWQPRQLHNYNLVYGNLTPAVLQPHLSQYYFHRPKQENQRRVQSTAQNVGNSLNGLRFWEKIATKIEKSGFIFSMMSYNVLAQDLLDQHPYLYSFHHKEALKWHVRWNNLLAEIKALNPDILCLQEVQKSHLEAYFAKLEDHLGYRRLYKQRTGPRTDGCAIFYKHNLLNLIEYTTVEYNQPNVQILDRDNVAIIAKFSPKSHPQKEFIVATTHLLYNPKRQDVRLAQTQLLLTEVDRIAFNPRSQYLPVILTGDLNSTPDSAVYKFITKGELKYEHLSSRALERGTNGPKIGKKFLPKSLRITDQCQHADLLPNRQNNASIPRSEELKIIELRHSERQSDKNKKQSRNKNDKELFASGTLSHDFALQSVYQHRSNGHIEGTTFQDEWLSVDYIFFSKRQPDTDELILLERYRLPTKNELGNMMIPNTNLGSDHLSLLAKFQLKV